jgi:malate dehydrogenase
MEVYDMKITVVGGSGVVGSSAAYRLAQDGLAAEIVLFDVRGNLAEAHALDIEQAVVCRSTTRVRGGNVADTAESDVILVTASVPKRDVEISRRDYLSVNLPLVFDTVRPLVPLSPSALWVVATSPVDPLVFLIAQAFSLPPARVIGLTRNDTSRFRWAISRVLGIPSTRVEAFVLGEHGDSQVPIFSNIKIDGEAVTLSAEQIGMVQAEIDGFFVKWNSLHAGRTAGWTSAESLGDIVSSMVYGGDPLWPCSSTLDGEYGHKDVSMGVPVRLAENRVKEIIELKLTGSEQAALAASADAIREMIRDGETMLKGIVSEKG